MRAIRISALVAAAHLLAGASHAVAPGHTDSIVVVVGRGSDVRGVTLDTLRELYLRQQRVWPDGSRAVPVNLPADTDVRKTFSKRVLGRLPEDLGSYWNRRYFEGITPPLVLRTPGAVCAYVAVEPKAIGYLRQADVDGETCRVLLVLPDEPR